MKLLFLRGKVDSRTQKVLRLSESNDMWTHLASAIGDTVKIVYWGGSRKVFYSDSVCEEWVDSFKYWHTEYKPDVVFARGGFPEYDRVVKRFPDAVKIYTGAGVRTHPKKGDYDIVLVDSVNDLKKGCSLWQKPAAPCFKPLQVPKTFDVCYVANAQQAKIKRVKWVYETIPKDISMLHLGYLTDYKVPDNVMRVRAERGNMPELYSQCKMGIIPYSAYDSGPRALSEMLACGVGPVVVLKDARLSLSGPLLVSDKEGFWNTVRVNLSTWSQRKAVGATVETAAKHIRGLIEQVRR